MCAPEDLISLKIKVYFYQHWEENVCVCSLLAPWSDPDITRSRSSSAFAILLFGDLSILCLPQIFFDNANPRRVALKEK